MVIVLMQDKVYAIDDFPAKVREKFPNTSILEVNKSCVRERLEQSKLTPLLTDGWAVIIQNNVSIEQAIPFCRDERNVVIVWIKPKDKKEVMTALKTEKIKFSLLDNINVSKEELCSYVSQELKVNKKDAITLCNRNNYYLPYVLESVTLLKSLGKDIKRTDILKFVDKRTSMTINKLFYHLIGYKMMETSLVAGYLYDFRYAFRYIKESLLKCLNDCIKIYYLIEEGRLGADNFKTFVFDEKICFSDYALEQIILKVHVSVPLEKLILVKIKVQKMTLEDLIDSI